MQLSCVRQSSAPCFSSTGSASAWEQLSTYRHLSLTTKQKLGRSYRRSACLSPGWLRRKKSLTCLTIQRGSVRRPNLAARGPTLLCDAQGRQDCRCYLHLPSRGEAICRKTDRVG